MSGAPGNASRSVHRALRDLVASYLDSQGIQAVTKRQAVSISDSLSEEVALVPDLSISGVDVDVSSKLRHRLSESLDSVQRGAILRDVPAYGFVQWRADRDISGAYVVLDLASFARLLRGDHLPSPP
ncbi:hypothetical protein [Microbacterium sp. W4I20]|uniref:hypothetical protein n=1 Tax=Microbacterium sp. W4I20 TaxID=3042262 RepID=UPI002781CC4E|nr:hypothetical protein [Microbacterium sp. W4I20]MDQ0725695.1 hypothetical protein [Microbacterium sp. W4I20]